MLPRGGVGYDCVLRSPLSVASLDSGARPSKCCNWIASRLAWSSVLILFYILTSSLRQVHFPGELHLVMICLFNNHSAAAYRTS
jgi:hypothetical protein